MTTKLPAQVKKTAGIPNGMRTATVTAVSATGVTISVSGGSFSSGVGVVTSYAPHVGDVVAVFRQDSSWLILGPTSTVNRWQRMSSIGYQSGFTDQSGQAPGQYRQNADFVHLFGEIQITSVPANPATILAGGLPAPGVPEAVMIANVGSLKVRLSVTSAGALLIYDATATGVLQMSCLYPIDPRLS